MRRMLLCFCREVTEGMWRCHRCHCVNQGYQKRCWNCHTPRKVR